MKLGIIFISLLLVFLVSSKEIFTLYPLANDYFDIIYEIKQIENSNKLKTSKDPSLFLRVYCKDHNIVSVSLTSSI